MNPLLFIMTEEQFFHFEKIHETIFFFKKKKRSSIALLERKRDSVQNILIEENRS